MTDEERGHGISRRRQIEVWLEGKNLKGGYVLKRTQGGKGVHRIASEFLAQTGVTEWTAEHRLHHPRFLGLRRDRKAKDVLREAPGKRT